MGTFFKEKKVGYWLMAGALVCGVVAMILYLACGTNQYVASLWGSITAAFIIFIVLAIGMLVYELRIVKYLASAVALYAFMMYIVLEINFLTNVFVSIDPVDSGVMTIFIVTVIFSVAAFGLSLASAVMCDSGLSKEKKTKKIKEPAGDEKAESEEAEA